MITEEELVAVNKELWKIDERIAELHNRTHPLEEKQRKLIVSEIVSKKMLTNPLWEIEPYSGGSFCLNYKGDIEDPIMTPILTWVGIVGIIHMSYRKVWS